MPGQGKKTGKAKETLYVSSLEIKGGHLAGGIGTVAVVESLRDSHAGR